MLQWNILCEYMHVEGMFMSHCGVMYVNILVQYVLQFILWVATL